MQIAILNSEYDQWKYDLYTQTKPKLDKSLIKCEGP